MEMVQKVEQVVKVGLGTMEMVLVEGFIIEILGSEFAGTRVGVAARYVFWCVSLRLRRRASRSLSVEAAGARWERAGFVASVPQRSAPFSRPSQLFLEGQAAS